MQRTAKIDSMMYNDSRSLFIQEKMDERLISYKPDFHNFSLQYTGELTIFIDNIESLVMVTKECERVFSLFVIPIH